MRVHYVLFSMFVFATSGVSYVSRAGTSKVPACTYASPELSDALRIWALFVSLRFPCSLPSWSLCPVAEEAGTCTGTLAIFTARSASLGSADPFSQKKRASVMGGKRKVRHRLGRTRATRYWTLLQEARGKKAVLLLFLDFCLGKKHSVRTATLELMDYKHVNDAKAKIEADLEGALRKLHRHKQQLSGVGNK